MLSPVELVGLLEDNWAMVRNGSISITSFLAVLSACSAARDHNVLRVIADRIDGLDLLVKDAGDTSARQKLRSLAEQRFAPHLTELGFVPRAGEPQNDVQRRAICITTLASTARVQSVIREVELLAQAEMVNPRAVDPNLAGPFVAIAASLATSHATIAGSRRSRPARPRARPTRSRAIPAHAVAFPSSGAGPAHAAAH